MSTLKQITDWMYILGLAVYGFILRPAYIIFDTVLELIWETIKAALEISYIITKTLIVSMCLILLSFFRIFVLGIVMKG